MPIIDHVVRCPLHKSFRTEQISGMFGVALTHQLEGRFSVDVPGEDEAWDVGAIVGPSGSGKTTIARAAFSQSYLEPENWPVGLAVIDCFDESLSIKKITGALTAVGFSSPPSWLKPYAVLSRGEQFRCELARSLLSRAQLSGGSERAADSETRPVVVFDEFTSVVDRQVAQFCSAAVTKAIRRGHVGRRFVAVSCHYDILKWLEPDWVIDMATSQLTRGCLRRPHIRLEVVHCRRDAWKLFASHHYLSGQLSCAAKCYLVTWKNRPVAFCAVIGVYGKRNYRRITRLVTLPDFQGMGIGMRLAEAVGEIVFEQGIRLCITASHPAVIAHCCRSGHWKQTGTKTLGHRVSSYTRAKGAKTSAGRGVSSFRYVSGPSKKLSATGCLPASV